MRFLFDGDLLGFKVLQVTLAHSRMKKFMPCQSGILWAASAMANIPCRTVMGLGKPVLPLVCNTTNGSHCASSKPLLYVKCFSARWSNQSFNEPKLLDSMSLCCSHGWTMRAWDGAKTTWWHSVSSNKRSCPASEFLGDTNRACRGQRGLGTSLRGH